MKQVVCRLCLKILDVGASEFELLGNVSHMLDLVSLKLNLHIVKEPLVCKDCKGKLQKCFNFKLICKHTGESLVSNMNTPENDEKVKMKECRFCSKLTKCNITSQLQRYEEFFATHMPEMRLKATNDVSICDSCHISLGNYADFIKTCSEQETKIENYRKFAGLHDENVESSVDLLRVLEYAVENYITTIKEEISVEEEKMIFEETTTTTTEVKQETSEEEKLLLGNATTAIDVCLNSNNILVDEEFLNADGNSNVQETVENNLMPVASETTEVSDGDSNCDSQSVIVLDDDTDEEPDNNVNGEKENNSVPRTTRQPAVNTGNTYLMMLLASTPMQQCNVSDQHRDNNTADFVVEINDDSSNEDTLQDCDTPPEINQYETLDSETEKIKCNICGSSQSKSKHLPKFHLCYDKNCADKPEYRCEICVYMSGKKSIMVRHMKVHLDESEMLKCADCEFRTRHESSLKAHEGRHKNRSELDLYRCHVCNFETRHKMSIKKHVLIHDLSGVKKYKCEICSFATTRNELLRLHMIVHKDVSEIETFKCALCPFQTRHKRCLKSHMIIHKNDSETTIYKCELCDFKTKRKDSLRKHVGGHDIPGAKIYLCEICGYKSKQEHHLKYVHMKKHDPSSNARKYKCDLCDYQAKLKNHLITHMITHKDPSEIEIFTCDICQFHTNYKHIIRNHMKRHNKCKKVK